MATREEMIGGDIPGSIPEAPAPAPTAPAPAPAPTPQGNIGDDPDFRGLDRETQKKIEAAADPWAALSSVMAAGGAPAPQAPAPDQPAPTPPATPTEGPAQPGPPPSHLVEGSPTGQTFEGSFAQPGSREAQIFQPRERLNLFRSLPQFRAPDQERGGMRMSPEYSPGGGEGGVGPGTDYGALEGATAPGGLDEEEMRRYILRRMG